MNVLNIKINEYETYGIKFNQEISSADELLGLIGRLGHVAKMMTKLSDLPTIATLRNDKVVKTKGNGRASLVQLFRNDKLGKKFIELWDKKASPEDMNKELSSFGVWIPTEWSRRDLTKAVWKVRTRLEIMGGEDVETTETASDS